MNRQASDNIKKSRTIWRNIVAKRGRRAFFARQLSLKWETINHWNHVPLEHVFAISVMLKIPPEELRPDFFQHDPLRRPNRISVQSGAVWPLNL